MKRFVIFLPSKYSYRADIPDVADKCGHKGKKSFDIPAKIVGIMSAHDKAQVRNGDARLSSLRLSVASPAFSGLKS